MKNYFHTIVYIFKYLKLGRLKNIAQKHINLQLFSENTKHIRDISINLLVLFFVVFIGVSVYLEFKRDIIIIEPLTVPLNFKDSGYTGTVLANKLMDRIYSLNRDAKSKDPKKFSTSWTDKPLSIEVSGIGLSPRNIAYYFRGLLGYDYLRIVGEITIEKDNIELVIREIGEEEGVFKHKYDKNKTSEVLAEILFQGAKYILKITDPNTLAFYYYEKDDKNSALETIFEMLENNNQKDDIQAYSTWGFILYEEKKYDEAITKYKKALEIDADNGWAFSAWGAALSLQNKYKEAESKFRKSIKLDSSPQNLRDVYNEWGKMLQSTMDYDGAIALHKKAIEADYKDTGGYEHIAYIFAKQEKHEDSISEIKKILNISPRNEWAYSTWAHIMMFQEEYESAIEIAKKAITINERSDVSHYIAGYSLFKIGENEGAEEMLMKSLSLQKDEYGDDLPPAAKFRYDTSMELIKEIQKSKK